MTVSDQRRAPLRTTTPIIICAMHRGACVAKALTM